MQRVGGSAAAPRRRARRRGDQPRAARRGRRRALPRGPLLPPQRHPDPAAAAARAARGHPAAGAPLPRPPRAPRRAASWRCRPRPRRRCWRTRWPGNVRELENAIERAVVLARGDAITPEDLLLEQRPAPRRAVDARDGTLQESPRPRRRRAHPRRARRRQGPARRGGARARHRAHDALPHDEALRHE